MLYILRHGLTDWNIEHKLQGRTDIPLNEEGRRMAEEARKEYANVHFDICYCSTLCRAKETARILLKGRNVPIIYDERLVEMGFGDFEGTVDYLKTPDCAIQTVFFEPEKYTASLGGSETFEELFARTGEFLRNVVKPQIELGRDVLIVGHGAMNSCLMCQIKNKPIEQFWSDGIPNCKLMSIDYK